MSAALLILAALCLTNAGRLALRRAGAAARMVSQRIARPQRVRVCL